MYGSPDISYGFVANQSADVRADFIKKVYQLFFLSLLVTVGVGAFTSQPAVLPTAFALMPVFLIAEFVCLIVMMFTRRAAGINTTLLYVFAGIQGAVFGPVLSMVDRYAPGIPLQAAVLTLTVFGGLTAYVLQSKKDFSYLGGFLFVALIAMLVGGLVMMFFHTALMSLVYSVFGVLLFPVLFSTILLRS